MWQIADIALIIKSPRNPSYNEVTSPYLHIMINIKAMTKMERVLVFADFNWLEKPELVRELCYEKLRGSDSYAFIRTQQSEKGGESHDIHLP